MRNILAIADKELRSYFASPIAYIMIGLFSLLFGVFFYLFLVAFVQQSEQMMQFGQGGAPNINQMMIGGLFQNTAVIILFMMPMITMRTYSEEKRSGTIELLLTSPLTDFEIIVADDGSTDKTLTILSDFSAQNPGRIRSRAGQETSSVITCSRAPMR